MLTLTGGASGGPATCRRRCLHQVDCCCHPAVGPPKGVQGCDLGRPTWPRASAGAPLLWLCPGPLLTARCVSRPQAAPSLQPEGARLSPQGAGPLRARTMAGWMGQPFRWELLMSPPTTRSPLLTQLHTRPWEGTWDLLPAASVLWVNRSLEMAPWELIISNKGNLEK